MPQMFPLFFVLLFLFISIIYLLLMIRIFWKATCILKVDFNDITSCLPKKILDTSW